MRLRPRSRQTKTELNQPPRPVHPVKKTALRDAILCELKAELARQAKAAELARDEAISTESQPENKWDTHSQEAAYLAEGQARQAMEVGQSLEVYATLALQDFSPADPIAVGAIVGLEGRGGTAWYFLGPRAGGLELEFDGRKLLVITPQSPLGRQLVGKRIGAEVVPPGTAKTTQRIAAVE